MAAACIVSDAVEIAGITDSKATKEVDRERAFEELMRHPGVRHGMCASQLNNQYTVPCAEQQFLLDSRQLARIFALSLQ